MDNSKITSVNAGTTSTIKSIQVIYTCTEMDDLSINSIGIDTKKIARDIMEDLTRKILEEDDTSLLEMINALIVEQISKLTEKSTDDLLRSVVAEEINTNITIKDLQHDISALLKKVNELEKVNLELQKRIIEKSQEYKVWWTGTSTSTNTTLT